MEDVCVCVCVHFASPEFSLGRQSWEETVVGLLMDTLRLREGRG